MSAVPIPHPREAVRPEPTRRRWKNLEKTYKNRIKDLRDDHEPRLSQHEICKIFEVSDTTYQSYEYGKTEPKLSTLIKMAKYYETSIDYIVGLTDERRPYPPSQKRGTPADTPLLTPPKKG